MAKEISISVNIAVGGNAPVVGSYSGTLDLSDSNVISNVQIVTDTPENLLLGDVSGSNPIIFIKNLSTEEDVTITNSADDNIVSVLHAGDVVLLRKADVTLQAAAAATSVRLHVLAISTD